MSLLILNLFSFIALTFLTILMWDGGMCDGLSSKLIQLCCIIFLPYLCHIINYCMKWVVFSEVWKKALITRILTLHSFSWILDQLVFCLHCRVFERIILRRLEMGMPLPPWTRRITSLELAKMLILIFLDLSKNFDSVHHQILLSMLHYIGLSNN